MKIIRFGSTHVHHMTLWAMNIDGSNEIQLKGRDNYIGDADVSRDGKWAFFSLHYENSRDDDTIIMKSTDGKEEYKVVKGYSPECSPVEDVVLYTINGYIWLVEY